MSVVIQPTGVYRNLYTGSRALASASTFSPMPAQPSAQQNAPLAQTQTEPASAGSKEPKKKSHWVLITALAVCAVVAGLFIGMPALGKALDTAKAKKFIEGTPLDFLKPALRNARKAIVSFGNTMDTKVKNFQQAARDAFDYLGKWHKKPDTSAASPAGSDVTP